MGADRPKIDGQSSGPDSGNRLMAVRAHSDSGEDPTGDRHAQFVFDRSLGHAGLPGEWGRGIMLSI